MACGRTLGNLERVTALKKLHWYSLAASEVLTALDVGEHGLSKAEADRRREEHGENELPQGDPPSRAKILLRQFQSPLIYILVLAGIVSAAIGETTDAGFIFAILVLNAVIGGFQEWKAEQSARALQALIRTSATVTRDDEITEIDARELVPGDIVWLESGNRVPADLRLLYEHGLEIDEALLTGESVPSQKDQDWTGDVGTSVGDRKNMAYAGSVVARGRARGVVVATGSHTLVGELARDVSAETGGKPPLLIRLERFTRVVGYATLAAAAVVTLLGLVIGFSLHEMFLFAVALAVSAVPEGLPVALTVALAVGTTRMAQKGVIVRKLAAVEGLGSCTMIASDKTGTLTQNELTVRRLVLPNGHIRDIEGTGYLPQGEISIAEADRPDTEGLARVAALCNEASLNRHGDSWTWRGDPTEVALLTLSHKLGFAQRELRERYPQIEEIPFEAERKFAATFHEMPDSTEILVAVKGAPERVLQMCGLDEESRRGHLETALASAAEGFRVLAFAEGRLSSPSLVADRASREPSDLRFLGFTAMIDPLRDGVADAIARCGDAGIRVVMVTGDHPVTALAIARELDLASEPEEVVSGLDLDETDPEDLARLIKQVRVFARVSPVQKLRIVEAAREAGHFVAVTGDGVNDAPALRAANIGVAMGESGTDVAREAADLVISDDNFATLVDGVGEGRVAYDNVRKVIYLLISTGAAEIVLVALSLVAGLPLPLLPVQLLWLNLVTNGIQDVALAFEPGEEDVLKRSPRDPAERIFNQLMIERTLIAAATMGTVGFAAFHWMLSNGWEEATARNSLLLLMVLFENVHLGNCRSETRSIFTMTPWKSPILLSGAAVAFLLHLGSMHVPFMQGILGTAPLPLGTFAVLAGLALSIAVVMEFHKWSWRIRHER